MTLMTTWEGLNLAPKNEYNGKMKKVVFEHQGLVFASSTNGKTIIIDRDMDNTGEFPNSRVEVLDYFVDNIAPNPHSPSPAIAAPSSKDKDSKSKKCSYLKSKKKAPKEPKSHKHYFPSKKSGKKSAKSGKAAK